MTPIVNKCKHLCFNVPYLVENVCGHMGSLQQQAGLLTESLDGEPPRKDVILFLIALFAFGLMSMISTDAKMFIQPGLVPQSRPRDRRRQWIVPVPSTDWPENGGAHPGEVVLILLKVIDEEVDAGRTYTESSRSCLTTKTILETFVSFSLVVVAASSFEVFVSNAAGLREEEEGESSFAVYCRYGQRGQIEEKMKTGRNDHIVLTDHNGSIGDHVGNGDNTAVALTVTFTTTTTTTATSVGGSRRSSRNRNRRVSQCITGGTRGCIGGYAVDLVVEICLFHLPHL
eukprot:scaffold482_cov266-Amphora_coffeaeformis.AAC.30